jgi:DNA-binding beta-propeller fold protein YncE
MNILLSFHFFKKKSVYFCCLLVFGWTVFAVAQEKNKIAFELQSVTDLSGNGLTQLDEPRGISVSLMGDIYIADTGHNRIVKLDAKAKYVNHVGGFGWKNNQFDAPVDVFASDGLNIYVADLNNQRIQRYSKKLDHVSSFGGSKLTELSIEASKTLDEPIGRPAGIAVSSQGDLFYSDSENDRIVRINRFGKKENTFGGFSEGRGKLKDPGKICVTSNFVYVADENRIVVFDYFGNYIREIGSGLLKKPADITVDQKGRLYVADTEKRTVMVFSSDGDYLTSILSYTFEQPVAIDCLFNKLYLLDAGTRAVIVFQIIESGE